MSAWIDALRSACANASQASVARQLGYTAPVVCQVLNGTYPRSTNRIRAAVERVLMRGTVECPVLGNITRQRCMENQQRPFTPTNPLNVKLYRACRSGCPHSHMSQTIFPRDASAAQPAVASNTGSPGAVPPKFRRVTEPTRRRKRPTTLGEKS